MLQNHAIKTRLLICSIMIFVASSGCDSEKEKQASIAKRAENKNAIRQRISENQLKIDNINVKVDGLKKSIEGQEKKWRDSITSRHPEWTPERRKSQIDILLDKWRNVTTKSEKEEDIVRNMETYFSRWDNWKLMKYDLTKEDYLDTVRLLTPSDASRWEIHNLTKPLDELKAEATRLEQQIKFYEQADKP